MSSAITAGAKNTNATEMSLQSTTVYFEDGLELTLDPGSVLSDREQITTRGTSNYDNVPSQYWGAYNSSDGNYYLQINGSRNVTFRGKNSTGREVLCYYGDVSNVYFNPIISDSDNFIVNYSKYTSFGSTTEVLNAPIEIGGRYNSSQKTFVIFSITYYHQ